MGFIAGVTTACPPGANLGRGAKSHVGFARNLDQAVVGDDVVDIGRIDVRLDDDVGDEVLTACRSGVRSRDDDPRVIDELVEDGRVRVSLDDTVGTVPQTPGHAPWILLSGEVSQVVAELPTGL